MRLNKSELGLIVEHMYWNLANVTEDFTENMIEYDGDIKLYKKLKNYVQSK